MDYFRSRYLFSIISQECSQTRDNKWCAKATAICQVFPPLPSKKMLKISKRLGHSLIVPYVHQPVTQFTADLVPQDQVRALNKNEGKWEFWTSSQAFYITTPKTRVAYYFMLRELLMCRLAKLGLSSDLENIREL